ncbi:MAG: peptidylprolyl isomerase [Clostridia bacterium]|nr:peptidylprolyl isomerase [Clostridia bacterium]
MATKTKKPLTSKQRTTRILVTAIIVTVALLIGSIAGALAYSNYLNGGGASRRLISFKTDHYKVNNCMLTYYYFTDAYNYYQNYGPYMAYMAPSQQAPDMTSSLSNQYYDYGTDSGTPKSWHEYLLNMTLSNVQGYLFYAEEALENDFECDVASLVDEYINNMKKDAKKNNITFEEHLEKFYGTTVKEKDVREALNLQYFASEYLNHLQDEYKKVVTDEELDKYVEENADTVNIIDYYSFSFETEIPEDMTDEDKTAADEANKTAAAALEEELKNAEDKPAAFKEWVTTYLTEKNLLEEEPMSEEDLATEIETKTAETTNQTKDEKSEFSLWAFEDGRVAGDIININEATAKHTVYLLTNPVHIDEDPTKNVRHILLTADEYGSNEAAKAKAEEVLDEFLNGETHTEADFDTIAEEYNEDGSSYYENVAKDAMVDTFDAWIFDESREVGDTGIVETQYGYHVMYFSGEGVPAWKADAISSIVEDKITAFAEELVEKYESSLTVNQENLLKIPDAFPAEAFSEPAETNAGGTEPEETEPTETETSTDDTTTDTAETSETTEDTTEETSEETAE